MSRRVGFAEVVTLGHTHQVHRVSGIDMRGVMELRREKKRIEKNGPHVIVAAVPDWADRRLERLCARFGLRYWYRTSGARVWGSWSD